jgi:chemotaxis protein methyltransferase CheR
MTGAGNMISTVGYREVEQFRALIAERLGLCFDDTRLGVLAEALRRRIDANGGAGEPYLRRLAAERSPTDELRQLARELTVTETYFFRSAEQIRAFVELALAQRLTPAETSKVRVLSAGCASGDEPYSLAMAIRESLPDAAANVTITGIDVNPAMLEKARRARYSAWSLRELSAERRARWFRADGDGFQLVDAIRHAVSFEERNLAQVNPELWQPHSWDIVFFRNVLMYFEPALARAVVARIARSLAPGGFLFLGHAETLRGLSNEFHLCHSHDTFYYQLKEGALDREATTAAAPSGAALVLPRFDDTATWVDTVRRASERIHALVELSRELSQPMPPAAPADLAREPETLLLRAVATVHRGALTQAEALCRELLACDEFSAGAHYVLALCREGLGDVEAALEADRVAMYLDPGFAMPRLHLGLLARRRGERELARRELAQALLLLQQEDASRLLLFGGGFSREALAALCRGELTKCGEAA